MRPFSRPMLIEALGEEGEICSALEPLPLKAGVGSPSAYDERWLQRLIQRNPSLLPVEQIEPAMAALAPICLELPLPSGFADNLMLTPEGGIVLVEAKLWRNPQARREVVGQVLDYAKDLSAWGYEELQQSVGKATGDPHADLFRLVHGPEAPEEAEKDFVDAVSRNLRLGRFLLIIAGDGIQESAEQLAEFLQRHIGLHFTLSLVEISLWRAPASGQVFVQPKVIARTVQIERAVVRLDDGVKAITAVSVTPASPAARPTTLSEEQFYDGLAKIDQGLASRLKGFLSRAEALGVYPDIKRNLSLKWRAGDGREFQLGLIDLEGCLATDYAHWSANAIGRVDLSHGYEGRLAAAVPGASVRRTATPVGWRVVLGDKNLPVARLLEHEQAWLDAIADYVAALEAALAAKDQG